MNVHDKRVLITGGSSRIEFALAQTMLAKGARVVITGRRQDALSSTIRQLRSAGGSIEALAADVTTSSGREATLSGAIESLGGLDILINNAGGVRAGRLENTSEAEIAAMIAVDLAAPIL